MAGIRSIARRLRGIRSGRPAGPPERRVDLRIAAPLFKRVQAHVEDFSRGEEAGFLVCSVSRLENRDVLLAREWIPVPDDAAERGTGGSVLSWSASFNSDALERALALDGTLVLVHSHGSPNPRFSRDDRQKERPLFSAFSRILGGLPTGTVVLGRADAIGSFWVNGENTMTLGEITIIDQPLTSWPDAERSTPTPAPRRRLARQSVAIGPASDAKLAAAKIGVVGISGGGSHVVQQLAHQGIGELIAVDDDTIDETNLGRVVGATEADIDVTRKIDLAERVTRGIDRKIKVVKVQQRFPSPEAIAALKEADVIVACLDRFDARENVNAFARRHLIPLVDVGLSILTSGERLVIADGQVAMALPGRPCLRCWLLTDAVLADERRRRPPGYDRNPNAPGDPQVVSMNGVLASEACNSVLDLITGYSGGRRKCKFWQYEGRTGTLVPYDEPSSNPACPACAEEGFGDPVAPLP